MSILCGMADLQADQKGRLRIPGKFRPYFDSCKTIYARKNPAGCIDIVTDEYINKVMESFDDVSMAGSSELSEAFAMFSAGLNELNEDSQGRFLLSPILRQFAHLGKEVRFIGVRDRLQLWDKETYVEKYEKDDERYNRSMAAIDSFANSRKANG
ncbi:MAG TPA: hypothetical protein IAA90_06245 [Candidatus Ornithoclostridium excrementipullorum]|nr:hypothetical protein [Candidatus Ornithoclostridium excrementipullorum]